MQKQPSGPSFSEEEGRSADDIGCTSEIRCFMVKVFLVSGMVMLMLIPGCRRPASQAAALQRAEGEFAAGNFTEAGRLADSLKAACPADTLLADRLDSLRELAMRVSLDFRLSRAETERQLSELAVSFTADDLQRWEELNWLEWRMIDGEKRYFSRAVPNLLRIIRHHEGKGKQGADYVPDSFDRFKMETAAGVIAASGRGQLAGPVGMTVRYTVTVADDAVPAVEIIRCWLPYPREDQPRQSGVKLLDTTPGEAVVSPVSASHRTLYLEQRALAGEPAVFSAGFSFVTCGQYFDPAGIPATVNDTSRALYGPYTSEEPPHLLFSKSLRALSDSVVGQETDPREVVRRIYEWIDRTVPWAGALEYGIIPDIPGYVIQNRRGDCGMKTLLFMALARCNGIPVRWQSGWMTHPGEVNLHDWCEVWFEGAGWVPMDMSFGLLPSGNREVRYFYLSGIDGYRFIVNDAIAAPLVPAKKYPRSDPVDFQRGEVEWRNGNLYFDRWSYKMEVVYE